ncbi:MAG: SIMPL domain-containing protein [Paludibacter sp.]|nr:SIMPL domain-containing protein [Paludibacter sp.]
MKRVLPLSVLMSLFMLIPLFSFAQSGEKNFIDQNYIEVTGKAEMEIVPDLIYLKIQLSEKDDKSKKTLSQRENEMIKMLKTKGVDTKTDLNVVDLSSNFKTYLLGKSDVLLSKEYQLVVKDTKTLMNVMLGLEKLGIANVSVDKVDNSDMEKYRREVKIEAVKAAKEKAQALAEAIGQQLGRAIYILESQPVFYNSRNMVANAMLFKTGEAAGMSDEQPEFEKIKLEYSVLCRFELK